MNEPVTTDETSRRWKRLLEVYDQLPSSSHSRVRTTDAAATRTTSVINPQRDSSEIDPFDCSSLVVPSSKDLVEKTINENLIRWKKLDDRKISKQQLHAGPAQGGGWYYKDDRLLLPAGFDYTTTRTNPPSDSDDDADGERVLCLDAPLTATGQPKTESYHSELWKLFKSIPTFDELEEKYHNNHLLNHTADVYHQMDKRVKYPEKIHTTPMSMFRLSDRHGYPPQSQDDYQKLDSSVTTVWLECWKLGTMPTPTSTPDEHRMVLEFWDGQTLLDVHNTIRKMIEDSQWYLVLKSRNKVTNIEKDAADVNNTDVTNHTVTTNNTSTWKDDEESGCFFIEDSCYKTGSIDYCERILDWLNGGKTAGNKVRLGYFGISTKDGICSHKMKDVKLSQIPFQIGTRYYHCCHGNIETSIMLIDRQESQKAPQYPIIHDTWIPSQWKAVPLCEACQYQKVFYTIGGECEATDGGPKLLCEQCCHDLRILEREPSKVAVFSSWLGPD